MGNLSLSKIPNKIQFCCPSGAITQSLLFAPLCIRSGLIFKILISVNSKKIFRQELRDYLPKFWFLPYHPEWPPQLTLLASSVGFSTNEEDKASKARANSRPAFSWFSEDGSLSSSAILEVVSSKSSRKFPKFCMTFAPGVEVTGCGSRIALAWLR